MEKKNQADSREEAELMDFKNVGADLPDGFQRVISLVKEAAECGLF